MLASLQSVPDIWSSELCGRQVWTKEATSAKEDTIHFSARDLYFLGQRRVFLEAPERERRGGGNVFRFVLLEQGAFKLFYRHQRGPAICEFV